MNRFGQCLGLVGIHVIVTVLGKSIDGPFRDITVNVIQAPRIRLLFANYVSCFVGVLEIPRELAELFCIAAEEVCRFRAGSAGVLPLGFGR